MSIGTGASAGAGRWIIALAAAVLSLPGFAEKPGRGERPAQPAIAFINAAVVPMDRETVLEGQTVIVRGGRIEAVGASGATPIPAGATVIDAAGQFLVPGLVDAHVHLDSTTGARPDFGDGPLFLGFGVTAVFNLRGESAQLEWKRDIGAEERIGPSLYNSGEFVNEPRVKTPERAREEVRRQKAARFDMIKLHQVIDESTGRYSTTKGMDRATYFAVCDEAKNEGMPLLGHGPVNLGLGAVLETGQTLAHSNEFHPLYFMVPFEKLSRHFLWIALSLAPVLMLGLFFGMRALVGKIRKRPAAATSPCLRRTLRLSYLAAPCFVLIVALAVLLIPGGLLFGSVFWLACQSLLGLIVAASLFFLLRQLVLSARRSGRSVTETIVGLIAALAVAGMTAFAVFWIPYGWRSSEPGMKRMARQCREAGVRVQSTLIIQQTFGLLFGDDATRVLENEDFRYLSEKTRTDWTSFGKPPASPASKLMARHAEWTRKLIGTLHREGVPVMAGTDVYGIPFLVPGASLHDELGLLAASGLSNYEALRCATAAPAEFLGQEADWGTIAPGKRADILMVAADPLKDLGVLRKPDGVMARGVWRDRRALDDLLAGLE